MCNSCGWIKIQACTPTIHHIQQECVSDETCMGKAQVNKCSPLCFLVPLLELMDFSSSLSAVHLLPLSHLCSLLFHVRAQQGDWLTLIHGHRRGLKHSGFI